MSCVCALQGEWSVVDFGLGAWPGELQSLLRRGRPQWWLDLRRCPACSQHWLVAQDERLNDVWVMRRVDEMAATRVLDEGRWPEDLDRYEAVIRKGAEWGHAARYGEPLETWPMAVDLIGQRPTMTDAELATLVNIDPEDAAIVAQHARRAIAARGYPYPWQGAGQDEYEPRPL